MKLYKGLKYGGKCRECKVDLPAGSTAYIDGKDLVCEPCYNKANPTAPTGGGGGQGIQRTVRCPYCQQESTESTITNIGKEFPDGTMKWVRVCASCARLREVVYRMKLDGLWPDKVPRPKSADGIPQPPVVGP